MMHIGASYLRSLIYANRLSHGPLSQPLSNPLSSGVKLRRRSDKFRGAQTTDSGVRRSRSQQLPAPAHPFFLAGVKASFPLRSSAQTFATSALKPAPSEILMLYY